MKRYITLIAILVAIYGAAALPTDSFIEDDTVVAEDDGFLEVPPALVEKTTKGKTMLIIGDSQAEFSSGVAYRTMGMEKKIPQSKYDFTSQCPTITRVINRGVSSSEALEWNKVAFFFPPQLFSLLSLTLLVFSRASPLAPLRTSISRLP